MYFTYANFSAKRHRNIKFFSHLKPVHYFNLIFNRKLLNLYFVYCFIKAISASFELYGLRLIPQSITIQYSRLIGDGIVRTTQQKICCGFD